MKFLFFTFIVFILMTENILAQSSPAEVNTSTQIKELGINLSEPPFWMPSYDEFTDYQVPQKDFYLEGLLLKLALVPSLQQTSRENLKEASEWYQSWDNIRKKLSIYCHDLTHKKACDKIADLRLQALNMFANQKIENRQTENKSEENSN